MQRAASGTVSESRATVLFFTRLPQSMQERSIFYKNSAGEMPALQSVSL